DRAIAVGREERVRDRDGVVREVELGDAGLRPEHAARARQTHLPGTCGSRHLEDDRLGHQAASAAMLTSQLTPNLSASIPNVAPHGAVERCSWISAPSASASQ